MEDRMADRRNEDSEALDNRHVASRDRDATRVDIARAAFGAVRRGRVARTATPMQVTRRIGR